MEPERGKQPAMTDIGQLTGGLGGRPRQRRVKLLGRGTAENADRRKLRSHVNVLRMRARRFCGGDAQTTEARLVTELLSKDDQWKDLEAAHEYADQLEELLPFVADEAYLHSVLAYELGGGHPDEAIKLTDVVQRVRAREVSESRGWHAV
jgi:hypothetical protein